MINNNGFVITPQGVTGDVDVIVSVGDGTADFPRTTMTAKINSKMARSIAIRLLQVADEAEAEADRERLA